ncbi:MAG: carboxypeptidase regulatory-like domain-containing protein [Gemmatimonadetes bacterium]|nr:carboxypeptidase regulatory-like domain-containing protein [Gemmatimonadota bacterium]MBI3569069.1 carboxypeptidase regulatory-like domain-containing protein [Gemmatimonadota bacterium]
MVSRFGLRTSVCVLLAIAATHAEAQASIVGTVYDSLSARAPLANAVIVLMERARYATSDQSGAFRFDSIPEGRYTLGLMHAVLDSFDVAAPRFAVDVTNGQTTIATLATPSPMTAYALGCADRLASVTDKKDILASMKVGTACSRLARRAERQAAMDAPPGDSVARASAGAQQLDAVVVRDSMRSNSLMAMDGFEIRRKQGLGVFLTPDVIAKWQDLTLAELLGSSLGVHVEYGVRGKPIVFLRGNKEARCLPTYVIDGARYESSRPGPAMRGNKGPGGLAPAGSGESPADFDDVATMAPPWTIKGIEIYSSSGVIPAQYDYTSSTGCGTVVIWTR